MIEIRPFARRDREQLTSLVNAHIASVLPGGSIPSATLLTQLEHPIGEYVIGPWVTELATLVAVERGRVVAAAHLRRYGKDEPVTEDYRDAGEVVWLLCWPNHLEAGRAVRDAALAHLDSWLVRVQYGDGSLPAPGVYGVSTSWPHVGALYKEAGFDPGDGQVEIIVAGALDGIPAPAAPAVPGLVLRRDVATIGTAFNAVLDGEVVGSYEVESLGQGGANQSVARWADECNHWVRADLRRRGIGTWLVCHAAQWLRLGGTTGLLAYVIEGELSANWIRYYGRYGLVPINRTVRGWAKAGR